MSNFLSHWVSIFRSLFLPARTDRVGWLRLHFRFNLGVWHYPVFVVLLTVTLIFAVVGFVGGAYDLYKKGDAGRVERRFLSVLSDRHAGSLGVAEDLGHLLADRLGQRGVLEYMESSGCARLQDLESELLIARGDSVVFWSTSYNPETWYLLRTGGNTFRLNSRWYWVFWDSLSVDGLVSATLLFLHTDYSIHNRYLGMEWAESLSFLSEGVPEGVRRLAPSVVSSTWRQEPVRGNNWLTLSYILSLLLLVFFPLPRREGLIVWFVGLLCVVVVGVRLLLLGYGAFRGTLGELFLPTLYGVSTFSPSLGDVLLHLLTLQAVIVLLSRLRLADRAFLAALWIGLGTLLIFLFPWYSDSLVLNSTLDVTPYFLSNLSVYALIAYITLGLLTGLGLYSLLVGLSGWPVGLRGFLQVVAVWVIYLGVYVLGFWLRNGRVNVVSLIVSVVVFLLAAFYTFGGRRIPFFMVKMSIFALVCSLTGSLSLDYQSRVKRLRVDRQLAEQSSNARDPMLEYNLVSVGESIARDESIRGYLRGGASNLKYLRSHFRRVYQSGVLRQYDVDFEILGSHADPPVLSLGSGYLVSPLEGSRYFSCVQQARSDRVSYRGLFSYRVSSSGPPVYLLVHLEPKLPNLQWGYPDLLIDDQQAQGRVPADHRSAIYRGVDLVTQSGEYQYPLHLSDSLYGVLQANLGADDRPSAGWCFGFGDGLGRCHRVHWDEHFVHHFFCLSTSEDALSWVVVSRSRLSFMDWLGGHAYSFFVFLCIFSVLFYPSRLFEVSGSRVRGLGARIQRFMLIAMGVLLLLSIVGVVYIGNLSAESIESRTRVEMLSRMRGGVSDLIRSRGLPNGDREQLNYALSRLAHTLRCDVNLYSPQGWLLGSSRMSVFVNHLQGERMNPEAFHCLDRQRGHYVEVVERIGDLEFASLYSAVVVEREYGAVVNIPYFSKPDATQRLVVSFASLMIAISFILFAVLLFMVLLFASRILRPLGELQQSVDTLSITGHNEPIQYSRQDEIGQLVASYNRMLSALEQSRRQLVESERQLAWREMARQIAHDIKTPLTPIKLSLQYLASRGDRGSAEWQARFDRFAVMLNDQIDTLSSTASSFSEFASLSDGHPESLAVGDSLSEALQIYADREDVSVSLVVAHGGGVRVWIDRTNFRRMVNNLVSNAVEAVVHASGDRVEVCSRVVDEGVVRISVADNGSGISADRRDDLFRFRFSTKSSGRGLGLSIVRAIVESAGGTVHFRSVVVGEEAALELGAELGDCVGEEPGLPVGAESGSVFWVDFPCVEGGES